MPLDDGTQPGGGDGFDFSKNSLEIHVIFAGVSEDIAERLRAKVLGCLKQAFTEAAIFDNYTVLPQLNRETLEDGSIVYRQATFTVYETAEKTPFPIDAVREISRRTVELFQQAVESTNLSGYQINAHDKLVFYNFDAGRRLKINLDADIEKCPGTRKLTFKLSLKLA